MTNPFEQITDIKARRLAFLEEMCAHYNNTNRAATESGACFYGPAPHSRGCAIGAWVPALSGCRGPIFLVQSEIPKILPDWMQSMGIRFLADCQVLHDNSEFWTDTGLSNEGLKHKRELIEQYTV